MLTRRNLISSLGGLVATSALPSIADVPSLFPERGVFERLQLGYHRIRVGATKPFSVLHISDTHLTAAGIDEPLTKQKLHRLRTRTFGGRQEEALRDSLDWAKRNCDYVLHTGDLIDWQSEANFALVKKYYGKTVFGSIGNHEFSRDMGMSEPKIEPTEADKDLSRAKVQDAFPFDISLASTVINGVNFVTLDDVYGTVTAKQVERFAAEVKKGLPIVLCMHVPYYTDDILIENNKFWRASSKFTSDAVPDTAGDIRRQRDDKVTADFFRYLKSEKLLKVILAGHLHFSCSDRFSPTAMEYVVGGNFLFHGNELLFTA